MFQVWRSLRCIIVIAINLNAFAPLSSSPAIIFVSYKRALSQLDAKVFDNESDAGKGTDGNQCAKE